MLKNIPAIRLNHVPRLILIISGIILAYKPVTWLVNTWQDPSYDSNGFFIFSLCVGLFIWSFSAKRVTQKPHNIILPICLLILSALIRFAGQILAVNMIGALMLVIDVYALGHLAALNQRRRAVSPFWLSVCFAFSLPLERLIQRTIGYGLQHISADGACLALKSMYDNVVCQGVRLIINQQDVLVDLPCSGSRTLLLLLFFFAFCSAIARFRFWNAVVGFTVTIITAITVNIVRITVLAIGISHPDTFAGIDVMAQPWHDLIGLMALLLGCLPIVIWTQFYFQNIEKPNYILDQARWGLPKSIKHDAWWLAPAKKGHVLRNGLLSLSLLAVSLMIIGLKGQPIDVASPSEPRALPLMIAGYHKESVSLSDQEEIYFKQYGGGVEKAVYDNISVMSVSTSAPLRHLHAPDECLRGLGMEVYYKGLVYEPIPTAIYKAIDENGQKYRIAVSFISEDRDLITTNVATAVWYWFQSPQEKWTAIQRISHWEEDAQKVKAFDLALISSLDLSAPSIQFAQLEQTGDYYESNH